MFLEVERKRGFTLVELLIVIAIIVLLVGSLGLAVIGALKRAEFARAEANIAAIQSAVKQYLSDWKSMPPIGTFSQPVTQIDPLLDEAKTINADLLYLLESEATIGVRPIQWTVGPYIRPDRGIAKEDIGGTPAPVNPDGTSKAFYIDPWGSPYYIVAPGLDHTSDSLPGLNNINWIDVFSLGPNAVVDEDESYDDDITNFRKISK
jgi:prepilin-type N-terminal cleavage/methylation domain-containing protein